MAKTTALLAGLGLATAAAGAATCRPRWPSTCACAASAPHDLVNETFLGAFSGIASSQGDEARFRSLVFTIAHRRPVGERRRVARRPDTTAGYDGTLAPGGGHTEDEALDSLGEERVRALLAEVVPDRRHVLLLRILGDLTVDQVAGVLGKSPGDVKSLPRRGLLRPGESSCRQGA